MKVFFFFAPVAGLLMAAISLCPGRGQAQPIGFMSPQPVRQPHFQCLSSPQGRFVFGQISDSPKDQYMLDTWTGRLWRIAESSGVGKYLVQVPYKLKGGKYSSLPEDIPFPKASPPKGKKQDLTK